MIMQEIQIDYTKTYMKDLRKFTPPEKNKIDDVIEGKRHDEAVEVIKSKKVRYE